MMHSLRWMEKTEKSICPAITEMKEPYIHTKATTEVSKTIIQIL